MGGESLAIAFTLQALPRPRDDNGLLCALRIDVRCPPSAGPPWCMYPSIAAANIVYSFSAGRGRHIGAAAITAMISDDNVMTGIVVSDNIGVHYSSSFSLV